MFCVGEKVCYPMHGIGVIEALEEKEVLGKVAKYYVVRLQRGKIAAMVPVDGAKKVGLRYVAGADEAKALLDFMKKPPTPEPDNWNQRQRENLDLMKEGSIFSVAEVVKRLSCRRDGRGLCTGDTKMLNLAKDILVEELCAAAGMEPERAENELGI